jgi:arylsulfatase A-like enzyme
LIDRRKFLFTPLALACAADRPPNLVLIIASGWRGQATPWDGDSDLVAPNLAKLGAQSVVFSRTYCASPKRELAQTALLTSKFPHAAKLDDKVLGSLKMLTPDAAATAFSKAPFAVRILLTSAGGPAPGPVHLRGNVPSAKVPSERGEVANFYGGCKNIDSALGEILGALDKLNLAQDTVIAFTSDCGQQLGSHGLDGGEVPFEESVRIPLAIRYPRKLQPEARDLASQVDIMPTLLALCGMEIPEGAQGQDLFGKTPSEVVFAEGKFGEADEWRMLVRGYDKIVATPKGEVIHLFNLAEDPYELTDLARDAAQKLKLASLKAQLQVEMKRLGDGMDPSGLRKR